MEPDNPAIEACPIGTHSRDSLDRGVQPPGPRGLPLVGVLPMIAKDPFGYLAGLVKRYGDVVQVPLPGMKMILVNHPNHVQRVLVQEAEKYELNPALKDAVTDLPYLPPFLPLSMETPGGGCGDY